MSRRIRQALILSLILTGCDGESENTSDLMTVLPSQAMVLTENGDSDDFVVKLNAAPSSPITIAAVAEDGLWLGADYVTVTSSDWQLAKSLSVSCKDDDTVEDRTLVVSFYAAGQDDRFNGLIVKRTVKCLDDGNDAEIEEKICEYGEILCLNSTDYRVCDVENNRWSSETMTCPTEKPVCDENAAPDACVASCVGDACDPIVIPPKVAEYIKIEGESNITSEDGQTAEFQISLGTKPTGNLFVKLASSDKTEGTVSPASLLFTTKNWYVPQNITVTGVPDMEQDGDVPYQIQFEMVGEDSRFTSLENVAIDMVNQDSTATLDGTPGVYVTPVSGLKTSEKGADSAFNVILTGTPTADVHIPVKSSDTSEGNVSVSELVFTTANWNQAQSVTVTGVDDTEADGDVAYQVVLGPIVSTDSRYNGLNVTSVNVTNEDNDAPDVPVSFTLSTSSLTVDESGKAVSFNIVPTEKPIADVVVNLTVSDATEGTITPTKLVFSEKVWNIPKSVQVRGLVDNMEDGDQTFNIQFDVSSEDPRYNDYEIQPVTVLCKDSDVHTGSSVKLRVMAANISSGNFQAYSEMHGVHIFQAVKPDVVLIQEFNWYNTSDSDEVAKTLVDEAFGSDYTFVRGRGSIPNGVISRYPILSSGYWKSNEIDNRDWDWAVIDLPGPKELLVVSVHLSTNKNAREMPVLIEDIQAKLDEDAKEGKSYFVMIGGDFNTSNRNATNTYMSDIFTTTEPYPEDQKGNPNTNSNRGKPYDYLMCSPDWCKYEIPVEIGTHTGNNAYKNGHVFDSRVYGKTKVGEGTELDYVSPVEYGDSDATNMQHMAVIRDFYYTY